jgi:hypothetical protein
MDYYEEFGVPRTASPDEIRQSYKALARLLHPDHFQDPALRRLAESQMKRINEIFAVLSDPVRRRQYDQPPPDPPPARFWAYAGWCAAVAVGVAWIATSRIPSRTPSLDSAPTVAATPRPEPAQAARPPARATARPALRALRQEPDAPPPAAVQPADPPAPPAAETPPPVTAPVEPLPALTVEPQPPPPRPRGFSGRWLYMRPAVALPSKDLYPPEYIEAAIVEEEGGVLRGRYRARYKVTDRAISPEVDFQFEGVASGDSASLAWTGGGGARGNVRLHQISADSLEVTWFATELGKNLGLASGTAVLVRRQEP